MSLLGAAARWALKEMVGPALHETGKGVGEAVGDFLARRISPQKFKKDSDHGKEDDDASDETDEYGAPDDTDEVEDPPDDPFP